MKYLTLLVLIATLFACKNRNIQDSKKNDLEGAELYFIGLNGPGIDSFNLPPYKLNFKNGQYRLSLDVNSCSGTYKMKGSEIKFNDDLSCTKICCDGPNAESFKEILKGNLTVKKEGENFILNKGELQLLLSKTAPQKLSALIGKKYLVSKAFSMGKEYKPDFAMTIEFTTTSFELQLNANACSGNCEISEDQIKFSNGTSCTEKCCDSELSQAIRSMFNGTMQYVIDEEHPVIFSKNARIWLVPYAEGKNDSGTMNADELIGKDLKIKDLTFIPKENESNQTTIKFAFDYILSFKTEGLGLKLDVNSCSSSAYYNGNSIEIGETMGCTKMCCDSKESIEVKNYLKGKFNLKKNGEDYLMSNEEISIQLTKP
jgi:heat shock protein HslJ